MKLTKIYRDMAKVADVASVANSGSIVIYTHSVRDEEEICDGIVRVVNAHEKLAQDCERLKSACHAAAMMIEGIKGDGNDFAKFLREQIAIAEKGETS